MDPQGLTPEERAKREKDKAAEDRAARRARRDLQEVLKTQAGRRVLWGILADAEIFNATFAGEVPLTNAYNEGRRKVGLKLLERITSANPKAFYEMMEASNTIEEDTDDA